MYICTILCSNTNLHCTRLTGGQIPHCNGCGWHWSTPTTSFSATFAFTEATFVFPLAAPQVAIKGMVNYQSSVVHSPLHWIDIIWKVFVCLQTILLVQKTHLIKEFFRRLGRTTCSHFLYAWVGGNKFINSSISSCCAAHASFCNTNNCLLTT